VEVKTTHRILKLWGWITSHILFNKRDPKLLQQEPRKGAETDSWVAFSKETAAEVHRRLKWVPCNIRRLYLGILRLPSGILTLDSGILTLGSGNAAVAHVHRLK
jgi:hypothetical protein